MNYTGNMCLFVLLKLYSVFVFCFWRGVIVLRIFNLYLAQDRINVYKKFDKLPS